MWRFWGKWESANSLATEEFLRRLESDEQLWVIIDGIDSEIRHYVDYPIDDDYIEIKFPVR